MCVCPKGSENWQPAGFSTPETLCRERIMTLPTEHTTPCGGDGWVGFGVVLHVASPNDNQKWPNRP